MKILDCGHKPSKHDVITTGYGEMNGEKYCYSCIADMDRESMVKTGNSKNLPLYDCNDHVGNWPNSLSFKVNYRSSSRHNIAGKAFHVWFNGPDGFVWHGVRYGAMTQIVHCKRTKTRYGLA